MTINFGSNDNEMFSMDKNILKLAKSIKGTIRKYYEIKVTASHGTSSHSRTFVITTFFGNETIKPNLTLTNNRINEN